MQRISKPDRLLGLKSLLESSEFDAFTQSLSCYPPRCVRLGSEYSADSLTFETRPVPWHPLGRIVCDSSIRPSQTIAYATRHYYIQDAGSLLALRLLAPQAGEWICDLCAAPGGKASAILETIEPTSALATQAQESQSSSIRSPSWLLANETIRSRVPVLEFMLARTGRSRYAVTNLDSQALTDLLPACFDAVLVDAPCSGQALVANEKHDSNAFDAQHVELNAARQRRILDNAVALLRPGGRIVYSTCTFSVQENESQIEYLQDQFPNCWEPIEIDALNSWKSPIANGCYRVWPHRDPTAGAFAGGLKWIGDDSPQRHSRITEKMSTMQFKDRGSRIKLAKRTSSERTLRPTRELSESFDRFGRLELKDLNVEESNVRFVPGDILSKLPPEAVESRVFRWPSLFELKRDRIEPTWALAAMQGSYFRAARRIEVSLEEAHQFMRGESIRSSCGVEDSELHQTPVSGWALVIYQGESLGWGKVVQGRINNHLPKIAWV